MAYTNATSRHIFIDESGDPDADLTKAGPSGYFVLTAVIVDSEFLEREEQKVRAISQRFFSGKEIKSKQVGKNRARRKEILKAISDVNFRHYSQVVDKGLILPESGLKYRKSFVKFISGILYEKLFESFTDMHVIADEYGTSEFMKSFSDYLQNHIPQRLFETSTFDHADSVDHPFLQIADFVAGTINRCYGAKDPMSVLEQLRSHTIIIDEWPPKYPEPLGYDDLSRADQYSYLVRKHALRQAERFIDDRWNSGDFYEQAQIAAVRHLLYHFRSVDPREYITTASLRWNLAELGFAMPVRTLRQRVIAALRDESVFIASGRAGIKIPYSVSDLRDYVSTVSGQVVPYLKRLQLCRKHFLLATEGDLDIVGESEFPDLARYMSPIAGGREEASR